MSSSERVEQKILAEYRVSSYGVPAEVAIVRRPDELVDIYELRRAKLKEATRVALGFLKQKIVESVPIKLSELLDPRQAEILKKKVQEKASEIVKREFGELLPQEEAVLVGKLVQEMLGLGDLELLLADENLEEIVVNSANEPVWVYHKEFGWLKSNVFIQSEEQILNYSAIIARKVGKQINNLAPLMDANLLSGDRVNATLFPISTKGNSITIRKFAKDPWTMASLVESKTLNLEVGALCWLATQYELNILVGGGTASGKTSLLNAILAFTPPNQRIISLEDSVAGGSEILFEENGKLVKGTIGELIDSKIKTMGFALPDGAEAAINAEGTKVFSMNKNGRIELAEPSMFMRHKVSKPLLRIQLASGREISVTKDHSLFTVGENNEIKQVAGADLKIGSFIATPRLITHEGAEVYFDLMNNLEHFSECMFIGKAGFREFLSTNRDKLNRVCPKQMIRYYIRTARLPVKVFMQLNLGLPDQLRNEIVIAPKRSSKYARKTIPTIISIDEDLALFAGLWLADGSYDKHSVIVSVVDEESRGVVRRVAKRFGSDVKMHSDGISLMINSTMLKRLMQKVLELTGDAYTKKVPNWVFGARKRIVAGLVNGYFSGDGWVKKHEVAVASCSLQLLKDVQTLLLRFGIMLRFTKWQGKDKTFQARVSGRRFISLFEQHISLLPAYKKEKLVALSLGMPHDLSDTVPLKKETYLKLKHLAGDKFKESLPYESWRSWQGAYAHRNIGRNVLKKVLDFAIVSPVATVNHSSLLAQLQMLAEGDLFWDKIIDIKEEVFRGFVYDLSVPGNESFVVNNIVAHNTREIVLHEFLHWTPMATRQPNPEGKGGVELLDLMVNSLRMRPDRIVLGEIRRQREAEVLFEAMHTGHAVYSTVHADDVVQVKNRLINPPINLPESVLSALHLVIVQYRQRRTGARRTFQVAEVVPHGDKVNFNVAYSWDARQDKLVQVSKLTRSLEYLALHTGWTEKEVLADLDEKQNLLGSMVKHKVFKIEQVGKISAEYYRNPEAVLDVVKKDKGFEEILGDVAQK